MKYIYYLIQNLRLGKIHKKIIGQNQMNIEKLFKYQHLKLMMVKS